MAGKSPPSSNRSSSVGRSSPCVRSRSPQVGGRSNSDVRCSPVPSEAQSTTEESSPSASVAGGSTELDMLIIKGRKMLVTGGERILLEFARDEIYYFTLFGEPFPSATDLTSYIHIAWEDAQRHHRVQIKASQESLAHVRPPGCELATKLAANSYPDASQALVSTCAAGLLDQD